MGNKGGAQKILGNFVSRAGGAVMYGVAEKTREVHVTTMVEQPVQSDEELAAAFAGGDRAAIERLVERHAGWVFASARRQLREEARAEDATQAVFLLLCQRAGKFRGRVRVSGWLFLATQFTVRAMQRAERRRRLHERRAAMEQKQADDSGAELAGVLDAAVMRLPARERAAVVLRFYQGKEFAEVARGLGITEMAARKRVTRAVERLRGRMGSGASAATIGAAALHGLPTHSVMLGAHVVQGTLKAMGGGAVPVHVTLAAKGAMTLMAMAKVQTVGIVAVVALLLLAGGICGTTWVMMHGAPSAPAVMMAPVAAQEPVAATAAAPETEPTFESLYRPGAADEIVHIAPPFVEGRLAFYQKDSPAQAAENPEGPDGMILHWKDGKLMVWGMTFGGGRGYTVKTLIDMFLDISEPEVEGAKRLLSKHVTGDFVVRDFGPKAEYRASLEKLLSDSLNQTVTLTFTDVERSVYVLKGRWSPTYMDVGSKEPQQLQVYGAVLNKNINEGGAGAGNIGELRKWLERWTGQTVVMEVTGAPDMISWHLNEAYEQADGRMQAHDPALVVQHVAEQTGLTATQENRKVRRLFIAAK